MVASFGMIWYSCFSRHILDYVRGGTRRRLADFQQASAIKPALQALSQKAVTWQSLAAEACQLEGIKAYATAI